MLGKKQDNILDSQGQIYEKGKGLEFIDLFLSMLSMLSFYNTSVERYYYFSHS